ESANLRTAAEKVGSAANPLVSLTSGPRAARIAETASGFVYCVSTLGVTGERNEFPPELEIFVRAVKTASPVPVAVGFGVSRPDQVARLRTYADAVVVGSALVRRCADIAALVAAGDESGAEAAFEALIAFARELSDSAVRTGT
ncbi:MAG: tryptophan synthase subunit alpha, partial [Firmicutes bacterium]|nr:tryptophan synthase subunit alpha [Bacillota bacterium]